MNHKTLTILFAILSIAGLVSFSMTIAEAQDTVDPVAKVEGLINSVYAISATVIGLVGAVVTLLHKIGVLKTEQKEKIMKVVEEVKSSDIWHQETRRLIVTLIRAAVATNPKLEKLLQDNGVELEKLDNDIETTDEELKKVYEQLQLVINK